MSNTARFALVLAIVCLAASGGVGSVYLLTRRPIVEKAAQTETALRATVVPGAEFFDEVEKGSGVFAARKTKDGPVVGYVAVGEAAGYGGKLQVMVGLSPELVVMKAAVLLQNETPGLGAELTKVQSRDTIWTVLFGGERHPRTSWMDQFGGKRPGQLALGAGIDAKTGCTITSRAIVTAARRAVEKVESRLSSGRTLSPQRAPSTQRRNPGSGAD